MDIRKDSDKDWLVIGWFTPDYRPLAEKLASQLEAHNAPFHLFARSKLHMEWDTRQKPSVVLEAMSVHPGKVLVLMDVDCIVCGDIEPATKLTTDVALSVKARQTRKGRAWQKQIVITLGSRVVVFRPTPGAQAFAEEWRRQCAKSKVGGDETAMAWAYLRCPEVAYSQLDPRYSGREVDAIGHPEGVVILHDSAHDPQRGGESVKGWLKALERRYLRTGRTKAASIDRLG